MLPLQAGWKVLAGDREGMADKEDPTWDTNAAWTECQHALPAASSSLMDMLPDPDRLLPFLASEDAMGGLHAAHGDASTSATPSHAPPAVGYKRSSDAFADDAWDTDPSNKAARFDAHAAKSKANREKQRRAQLNCR
jgi:hypothetical protein